MQRRPRASGHRSAIGSEIDAAIQYGYSAYRHAGQLGAFALQVEDDERWLEIVFNSTCR